jgi:hypothetical protein
MKANLIQTAKTAALLGMTIAAVAGCSSSSIVQEGPRHYTPVSRTCRVAQRPACTRVYVDTDTIVQSYIPQRVARTSVYDTPVQSCPSPYDLSD